MEAIQSLLGCTQSPRPTAERLYEPPGCAASLSSSGGGKVYLWGGGGPDVKETTLYSFDPLTEQWSQEETQGIPHLGVFGGACVFLDGHLYMFGGTDGVSSHNTLLKLNVESLQWSQVASGGEGPMRKHSCGLVAIDDFRLCCFGGYGVSTGSMEPESRFIYCPGASDTQGWTNECHIFNTKEGTWSALEMKDKPIPYSHFAFTKVDQHRAIMFGGAQQPVNSAMSELYEFDFSKMVVTLSPVEYPIGEPRPMIRAPYAGCCLNYGLEHPQVLVFGGEGVDSGYKDSNHMWLLDVDTHHWTEVVLPKPIKGQMLHTLTAISLAPGLTEVLLFGGELEFNINSSNINTGTYILRFECLPGSNQWTLVDFADNRTRVSSQRLSEKRALISRHSSI